LSSPTQGCSFETEKSNWTKLTQIEKTSGKIVRTVMIRIAGETSSQRTCRSIQEEAARGRLLPTVSARAAIEGGYLTCTASPSFATVLAAVAPGSLRNWAYAFRWFDTPSFCVIESHSLAASSSPFLGSLPA
jgi:hypothetical protein